MPAANWCSMPRTRSVTRSSVSNCAGSQCHMTRTVHRQRAHQIVQRLGNRNHRRQTDGLRDSRQRVRAPHDVRRHSARWLVAPLGNIVGEHTNALVGLGQEDRIQPMTDLERPNSLDVFAAGLFRPRWELRPLHALQEPRSRGLRRRTLRAACVTAGTSSKLTSATSTQYLRCPYLRAARQ